MRHNTNIRLYVSEDLTENQVLSLDKEQSHYLGNVMRKNPGDQLLTFNGRHGEWLSEIIDANKRSVTLKALEQTQPQKTEPDLWLAFAPIKKARLDFIAQKATELGVGHIIPVLTRRTIVDRVKTERMHANAIEAAEQCERLTVPTIGETLKLEKLIDQWPTDRALMFCDEDLSGDDAYSALKKYQSAHWIDKCGILIGPEGGFDDYERELIKSQPNTLVVSLGPRVLRADTAAISAITLWQAAVGDWSVSQ
ncbi:16S rRNA (uracil(1498)-N(3))-methyltransferase [Kordiimonas sp. SCSIO 12610]|uniref:16S rRNA (uracil(1498)-N(3))-methyltransferase n=1 Tax=Kordiimonas sp. SCSIO 12610 TaxID=2829597 RepID=UPI002109BA26|nr:16S rRNA (uracil(1498)-N(3))-methyltransferase [Kordiimonas sp. SCSIO 12610]UTW54924.1 16S rRNA (uracil(1498)-N(3))-methyltransferase [Kordiimonas sp. SCSIO 12610]